jgi:hypothetical protein
VRGCAAHLGYTLNLWFRLAEGLPLHTHLRLEARAEAHKVPGGTLPQASMTAWALPTDTLAQQGFETSSWRMGSIGLSGWPLIFA